MIGVVLLFAQPLCCPASRCFQPRTNVLHCAVHCAGLYCTALHCTALHCTALNCTELHCTELHCTALNCTALHCTALHCTALHIETLKKRNAIKNTPDMFLMASAQTAV